MAYFLNYFKDVSGNRLKVKMDDTHWSFHRNAIGFKVSH